MHSFLVVSILQHDFCWGNHIGKKILPWMFLPLFRFYIWEKYSSNTTIASPPTMFQTWKIGSLHSEIFRDFNTSRNIFFIKFFQVNLFSFYILIIFIVCWQLSILWKKWTWTNENHDNHKMSSLSNLVMTLCLSGSADWILYQNNLSLKGATGGQNWRSDHDS